MLSPKELDEYFERTGLSETAVTLIHRIRTSHPERRVESGEVSVASRYSSLKMNHIVQAESHSNELPSVIEWEFDPNTYEFWDQPQKLKITYVAKNGKQVTHLTTSDYFLLQEGFAGWVECKTEQHLQQSLDSGSQLFIKDEQGRWRCPAGEAAAAEFGLKFIVRSSAQNNPTLVRNLGFLDDYLDSRCPAVSVDEAKSILEAFKTSAWYEVKSLIDAGFNPDHIYKMLADQQLYFDINSQLLARTHLTLIYRDRAAYEAYRLHIQTHREDINKLTSAIKIAAGETFLWDGVLWTIVNPGTHHLHIKNSGGEIVELKYSVFDQLAYEQKITGVNKADSEVDSRVEEILRLASPDAHRIATERYNQIFAQDPSQVTASERTLRRWNSMFRHAELAYGYGYVGLLSTSTNRGNRNSKIDQRVLEIADEVIREFYLKPNGRSVTVCWGEVEVRCSERGLTPPSEKTFLAQIRKLSSNDVKRTREGAKAAYSSSPFIWYLEQTTARHGDRVFEIAHIDHTELDLQLVDSKTGANSGKAWLTVLLDAYTRMVLAWVISFEPPSYRSCMAVILQCVKRHGRVPKTFVLDQGAEFRSTYFETLLARLESHKKERPGSKPRFGSVIERFFGVNNQTFIHNLKGNNKPLQNPRSLSRSHDPRKLAIWTLHTLREAFSTYIETVYSKLEHAALGVSPETAMAISLDQSGHRYHKHIPYTKDFIMMCWPTTPKGTAKIEPSRGVKIGYIYYWNPEFHDRRYHHRQVPVRYDPFNKAMATAYINGHWVICESEYKEVFQGLTEKQVDEATQEIRAIFKRTGERRAIKAYVLAEFFRNITKTEQGLIDHLRHAESQSSTYSPLIAEDLPKQVTGPNPAETEDIWANLNIQFLGEFEV